MMLALFIEAIWQPGALYESYKPIRSAVLPKSSNRVCLHLFRLSCPACQPGWLWLTAQFKERSL